MKLGLYYGDSYAFSRFNNVENTHSLECASRDIMYLLNYILSEQALWSGVPFHYGMASAAVLIELQQGTTHSDAHCK
jgi:hypothetical protein